MSHTTIDFHALIRENGHRLTPQRQIILDTLCEMGGHVTVAALYERVHGRYPAIDRSTVYRAMDFFSELGLVTSADVSGSAVYEIASSDIHGAHHHLVCRECAHIDHIPEGAFREFTARLSDEFGFAADLDNLTIYGTCRECDQALAA